MPQDEAIEDEAFGGFIAPLIQALDHEHTEDHLDRGTVSALGHAVGIALDEITLDALEDRIVVQQAIEPLQNRCEGGVARRDEREEIDGLVAMHDHDAEASGEWRDGLTTPSYAPDCRFLAILRQKPVLVGCFGNSARALGPYLGGLRLPLRLPAV